MATLRTRAITDAMISHAKRLGIFEDVLRYEPKSAPPNGMYACVFFDNLRTVGGQSGLNKTSAVVTYTVRIYTNMIQQPEDDIEILLLDAVDTLLEAYNADFDLGETGTVESIDILGKHGQALEVDAGYIEIDKKHFRVAVITVPIVVNDAWTQSA